MRADSETTYWNTYQQMRRPAAATAIRRSRRSAEYFPILVETMLSCASRASSMSVVLRTRAPSGRLPWTAQHF
jgi:hypothetical protein